MNNKGIVGFTLAAVIVGGLAIVALPFMTPRFRVQKANEICVEDGMSEGLCAEKVKQMSKTEILEYIRDI